MKHDQPLGCRIEPRKECLGGCGLLCTQTLLVRRPEPMPGEEVWARLHPVPVPLAASPISGLDFGDELDWRNYLASAPGDGFGARFP